VEPFKTYTHSFVVKIQLEETADARRPVWRGRITHVPSGALRYLKDLDGIKTFILPYLEDMGGERRVRRRIWKWLKR
jgi:hypothetical protein